MTPSNPVPTYSVNKKNKRILRDVFNKYPLESSSRPSICTSTSTDLIPYITIAHTCRLISNLYITIMDIQAQTILLTHVRVMKAILKPKLVPYKLYHSLRGE